MEFRSNIFFSFVLHATFFAAALALAGRAPAVRISERYVAITLLEDSADRKTSGTVRENKIEAPRKTGKAVTILREATPPEVSSVKKADIEPAAEVRLKENQYEGEMGPAESQANADRITTSPGQDVGGSGKAPGAMQLTVPSGAVTPGVSGGGNNKTSTRDADAVNAIRAAIERAKSYPPLARKRGLEGTVTAAFTINAKGYPDYIRIVKSSGYEILDSAAKKTLLRASPFPQQVRGKIEVPITFRIER